MPRRPVCPPGDARRHRDLHARGVVAVDGQDDGLDRQPKHPLQVAAQLDAGGVLGVHTVGQFDGERVGPVGGFGHGRCDDARTEQRFGAFRADRVRPSGDQVPGLFRQHRVILGWGRVLRPCSHRPTGAPANALRQSNPDPMAGHQPTATPSDHAEPAAAQ